MSLLERYHVTLPLHSDDDVPDTAPGVEPSVKRDEGGRDGREVKKREGGGEESARGRQPRRNAARRYMAAGLGP